MNLQSALRILDAFFMITLFGVAPLIAGAIGYAAWRGRPKAFSRRKFAISFYAAMIASGFLLVHSQRMHADVRSERFLLQMACFLAGALLFGVAGGCMVGMFAYRVSPSTQDVHKHSRDDS